MLEKRGVQHARVAKVTFGYSPGKGVPSQVLDALPHELGELLLVDFDHLLLGNVVVFVFSEFRPLLLGEGARALAVGRFGVFVAVRVLDGRFHLQM